MPNGRDKRLLERQPADRLTVMNARLGDLSDLDRQGYIFEPKLDGYRALCYVNGDLIFLSRNDIDLTSTYPELEFRKAIKAKSCILDGEIVAYDEDGNPRFDLLQQGYPATYVVFDILMLNGSLLTDQPLIERKKILHDIITPTETLETIFFTKDGHKLYQAMIKRSLEGVMAKEERGKYYPGMRSSTWIKIKHTNTIDCVIVGFSSKGKRIISSLALGLYDAQGHLHYCGKVGTGFSEKFLHEFYQYASMMRSLTKPVIENPRETITWLKPLLVCEIKYHEMTRDGFFRAPVFLRMRFDKEAAECVIEDQFKSL